MLNCTSTGHLEPAQILASPSSALSAGVMGELELLEQTGSSGQRTWIHREPGFVSSAAHRSACSGVGEGGGLGVRKMVPRSSVSSFTLYQVIYQSL